MKYFYDTEFIDDGSRIDLISIGVVAEDGREFYAEATDADLSKANDWVKENVITHLWSRQSDRRSANLWTRDGGCGGLLYKREIARDLVRFMDVGVFGKPEFWGYYSAYDHVALMQLYGPMINKPDKWPMYTMDLKQWCKSLGDPELPKQGKGEHHSLSDARWVRDAHQFLTEYAEKRNATSK